MTEHENIGSSFGLDIAVICVGDAPKVFAIHTDVLKANSRFFDAALSGNFKESTDNAIHLPEEDPAIFGSYASYLYSKDILPWPPNRGASVDQILTLVKMFTLAERLFDEEFQSSVMEALLVATRADKTARMRLCTTVEIVEYVWEQTSPESALRQHVLDIYIHVASPTWIDSVSEKLNSDFLADVVSALIKSRTKPTRKLPDPHRYIGREGALIPGKRRSNGEMELRVAPKSAN